MDFGAAILDVGGEVAVLGDGAAADDADFEGVTPDNFRAVDAPGLGI